MKKWDILTIACLAILIAMPFLSTEWQKWIAFTGILVAIAILLSLIWQAFKPAK